MAILTAKSLFDSKCNSIRENRKVKGKYWAQEATTGSYFSYFMVKHQTPSTWTNGELSDIHKHTPGNNFRSPSARGWTLEFPFYLTDIIIDMISTKIENEGTVLRYKQHKQQVCQKAMKWAELLQNWGQVTNDLTRDVGPKMYDIIHQ